MLLYHAYSLHRIILRRIAVVIIGFIALPFMVFRHDRSKFYSYLHRVWCKTSSQPVWLAQSEAAGYEFH